MMVMTINLARLREYPIVAPDVETTGLYWYRGDKIFGIALAVYDGQRVESTYFDIREKPRVLEALVAEMPHCQRVVNHNIKFDCHMLREAGIHLPMDRIECTSVRAALIDEWEPSFSLDALGKKYIGEGKVDIWQELAAMFGGAPIRSVQIKNLHRAPAKIAAKYAAPDPALAIKLWLWQEQEIQKQELQQVWDLERRLTPVLIDIERHGVRVDEARAREQTKVASLQVAKAQRALNQLAGREVNANSPTQMRALFGAKNVGTQEKPKWETDTGIPLLTTDAGAPSIDKDALTDMMMKEDKRAGFIVTIRKMLKAKQFLDEHIIGHAVGGRVYPNYNQTRGENELGTGTGRFSVNDPALQQIPARDKDVASVVRSCFIPDKGHMWGCADWDQFEFRWFAHYTEDAKILETYATDPDSDFHQLVADITGIPRNARFAGDANAKQINLGLVFGMGRGEMAYQMGLEYTVNDQGWKRAGPKANELFDRYHNAIPGVRQLLDRAASIARARGYVRTAGGRHIRFPRGQYHKAAGLVFQGTSADCMKLKMIELFAWCKEQGIPILLSVHDELDFGMPKDPKEAQAAKAHIQRVLQTFDGVESPIKCDVPIRSSLNIGPNWWEASK
jgi:Mesyanzhinovviridae DNA polymerase